MGRKKERKERNFHNTKETYYILSFFFFSYFNLGSTFQFATGKGRVCVSVSVSVGENLRSCLCGNKKKE